MTIDAPTPSEKVNPPIKSGWRGELSGAIEGTDSHIKCTELTLRLDRRTAYALCNLLADSAIERSCALEDEQVPAMSNLGAALGRLIDHPSANNGGRKCLK